VADGGVFTPYRLGPVELRNRTVKAATFENLAPDGLVSDELTAFHRRFAAGGIGMTTLAYVSASPEGRTYRDQLVMAPRAVPGLTAFTDAMHDAGAAAQVQLGHAGWFASPHVTKQAPLGPSRTFSPRAMTFSQAATHDDLDRLLRDFEQAGRLAVEAGFDAIEVHLGHGYLLSQFLSPWTNRRRDEFGGDAVGRARFPRRAVDAVRAGAGDRAAVTAKLNMEDGFKSGLQVDDALEIARLLEADGNLDLIQLTVGFTARTPMALLHGDPPITELADLEKSGVRRVGMKFFARFLMDDIPFEEAFLLPLARRFRQAVTMPLCLLGGITRRETMDRAVDDEGFQLVAMGRALLFDPDHVNRLRDGEVAGSDCIHCNRCIVEMEKSGAKCVVEGAPGAVPAGR
jgi:2,4-dienoyl-CoA reductase-like NADH-dependent reductase (Old Yellow Enzyme family)